jgi:hypothetical protein
MSTASSIVGTWYGYVAWGCSGAPIQNASTTWTFKADGSWSYEFGGGRWIQVEGLVAWNFKNAANLVYTANVTLNALDGIMGYPVSGSSPGTGCFYAVRQKPPGAAAEHAAAKEHDLTLGPHK